MPPNALQGLRCNRRMFHRKGICDWCDKVRYLPAFAMKVGTIPKASCYILCQEGNQIKEGAWIEAYPLIELGGHGSHPYTGKILIFDPVFKHINMERI